MKQKKKKKDLFSLLKSTEMVTWYKNITLWLLHIFCGSNFVQHTKYLSINIPKIISKRVWEVSQINSQNKPSFHGYYTLSEANFVQWPWLYEIHAQSSTALNSLAHSKIPHSDWLIFVAVTLLFQCTVSRCNSCGAQVNYNGEVQCKQTYIVLGPNADM